MQTEWKLFGILLVVVIIIIAALFGLSVLAPLQEPEQVPAPTPIPIAVSSPTPTPKTAEQAICEVRGGVWGQHGLAQVWLCNLPTADAKEICTDSVSWLHSPSAVILEPQKIKSDTVSTVSPSICHEVMGPDAMIFVF